VETHKRLPPLPAILEIINRRGGSASAYRHIWAARLDDALRAIRDFDLVFVEAWNELSVVERCERSVMSDQFDGLGFPRRFVAAHAGRVRWHSRHRDPDGVGSLLKQRDERSDRDMALYDVAIDQSGMTRDRIERNTNLCLERDETPVFLHLYFGSVVL
jgi:hypothetical protein